MRPNTTALAAMIVCTLTFGVHGQGMRSVDDSASRLQSTTASHPEHSQAVQQGWTRSSPVESGGYSNPSRQTASSNTPSIGSSITSAGLPGSREYSGSNNTGPAVTRGGSSAGSGVVSSAVVHASSQARVPPGSASNVPPGQLASTQERGTQDAAVKRLTPISSQAREDTTAKKSGGVIGTLVSILSSLAIVVGLFWGLVWVYRKTSNQSAGSSLPKDVVRILGRTPIAARQQMVLLHFGSKLVLVSVVQGDARTISEITDPDEVQRLAGMCQGAAPGTSSESFRSFLTQGAKK